MKEFAKCFASCSYIFQNDYIKWNWFARTVHGYNYILNNSWELYDPPYRMSWPPVWETLLYYLQIKMWHRHHLQIIRYCTMKWETLLIHHSTQFYCIMKHGLECLSNNYRVRIPNASTSKLITCSSLIWFPKLLTKSLVINWLR
jgi:hypothetical protein